MREDRGVIYSMVITNRTLSQSLKRTRQVLVHPKPSKRRKTIRVIRLLIVMCGLYL